jgi:heat shock protein 4
LIRLEVGCEKLKKVLNTVPEAPINIDCFMNDVDVRGMMKRADLENTFKPLLSRVLAPVKRAIEDSLIPIEKISALEISGGGTRLIPVQNMLTEFFGRDLSKTQNFEETVCRGCALQCAILSPVFKVREFSITDVSMYPINFTWKAAGKEAQDPKDFAEVFTRNNVVPSSKMITMHRTDGVELSAIYSDIGLLPAGTDALIAKFVIPTLPITKNEPAKIRVKVKLDLHGIVTVEGAEMTEAVDAPAEEEKKAEDPMQTDEKKPEEGTPKTEEKKEKKKVTRTNLQVQEVTTSIPKRELENLTEEEGKMVASDRLAFETAEKKNAVESYVYEMRDKLSGILSEFSSATDKEPFLKLLETTQDWLYGEGEDVTKSVYSKKLDELKLHGDPITKRHHEYEHRFDEITAIKNTINTIKMNATSADPKYDHISAEDKQKVVTECETTEKWLNEKLQQQEKLSKSANPIITVAEIHKKNEELTRMANSALNKPKPKPEPKKEEKKEEKPAEEPKKEDEKKEEEKKEMDLD